MDKLRNIIEPRFFGVCAYLGEKFNIPSSQIRLFFIYSSFVTAGSPIIIYLCLAFVIKLKDYIRGRRSPLWDF
ncbi:MAG: hypothetical protein KatS3mg031_0097 [Chitinophagales bacterium]|nr:MAG: hypothetical protein KatS3mg031_0097 [Chitinophagales bacterium]